ncbi:hypothetical protein ACOME3_009368 [Neoechinorhynchus agilis]
MKYKNLILTVHQYIIFHQKRQENELVKSIIDINHTGMGPVVEMVDFILPAQLMAPSFNFAGGISMKPTTIKVNYVINLKLNVKGFFNRALSVDIPLTVGTIRTTPSIRASMDSTRSVVSQNNVNTLPVRSTEANVATPPSYASLYPNIINGEDASSVLEPSAPPLPEISIEYQHDDSNTIANAVTNVQSKSETAS